MSGIVYPKTVLYRSGVRHACEHESYAEAEKHCFKHDVAVREGLRIGLVGILQVPVCSAVMTECYAFHH